MSDIAEKLEAIDSRFRHDSKQWRAARYIVRQNRKVTSDERKAICQEIPIKYKSLQGLFTELRKMGLYPPQETSDTSDLTLPPETSEEPSHHVPEDPQPPMQEYATKEDVEILKTSINYLAAVISGENIENPSEDEEEEEDVEVISPEEFELIPQEELIIEDPSLTRKTIWLKPKTQMYFDLARQKVFSNYVGTKELGPFNNFTGNLSDFFNILTDDYFNCLFNKDITLQKYNAELEVS